MVNTLYVLALVCQIIGVLMLKNVSQKVMTNYLNRPANVSKHLLGIPVIGLAWFSLNGGIIINAISSFSGFLILAIIWWSDNRVPLKYIGGGFETLLPSQKTNLKAHKWLLKAPFVFLLIVSAIQLSGIIEKIGG